MMKYTCIYSALAVFALLLAGCREDIVYRTDFFPAPKVVFPSDTLRVDLNQDIPEICIRVYSAQGVEHITCGIGTADLEETIPSGDAVIQKEFDGGGIRDTVFLNFVPDLSLQSTYLEVVAEDSRGIVKTARWPVSLSIGAAPTITPVSATLPEDIGTLDSYLLNGTVLSDVGLSLWEVTLVTGTSMEDMAEIPYVQETEFVDMRNYAYSYTLNRDELTNLVAVKLHAEDRFGQQADLRVSFGEGEPPVVEPSVLAIPATALVEESYQIEGHISSEVGLKQVQVTLLRGEDFDTSVPETLTTVTSFEDNKEYDYTFILNDLSRLQGVKIVAQDKIWQTTEKVLKVVDVLPIETYTDMEAFGLRNKKSSPTAFSLTTHEGYGNEERHEKYKYAYDINEVYQVENYKLVDLIFWCPDKTKAEYELWSPKAAAVQGGTTYFPKDLGPWNVLNNTWFGWIGNTDPATNRPSETGVPQIDWDKIDYLTMQGYTWGTAPDDGGALKLADLNGNGVKTGDVILVVTDTAKLVEPNKRIVIHVTQVKLVSAEGSGNLHDARMIFDMKTY